MNSFESCTQWNSLRKSILIGSLTWEYGSLHAIAMIRKSYHTIEMIMLIYHNNIQNTVTNSENAFI